MRWWNIIPVLMHPSQQYKPYDEQWDQRRGDEAQDLERDKSGAIFSLTRQQITQEC